MSGSYSEALAWSIGGYAISAALMLIVGRITPKPLDQTAQ
jgi:hypothetical protein